jgi:DNA-binding transcriptional MocR family regulator
MRPDAALMMTERARVVRRRLPSAAWVVLEELTLAAAPGDEVESNVRTLAGSLGLSKDTVARALRRLHDDGLVTRVDGRDGASGRFDRAVYRVDIDAVGLTMADERALTPAAPTDSKTHAATSAVSVDRRARRPRPRRDPAPGPTVTVVPGQLDLFGA